MVEFLISAYSGPSFRQAFDQDLLREGLADIQEYIEGTAI
jgi:hypothetical protein